MKLFILSDNSLELLQSRIKILNNYLTINNNIDFEKFCDDCMFADKNQQYRLVIFSESMSDLKDKLNKFVNNISDESIIFQKINNQTKIVFCYPGGNTGSWINLSKDLLFRSREFYQVFYDINHFLTKKCGIPLLEIFQNNVEFTELQVFFEELVNFSLKMALTAMWISIGVEPAAYTGLCLGEIVASYFAKIYTFIETIHLQYIISKRLVELHGKNKLMIVEIDDNHLATLLDKSQLSNSIYKIIEIDVNKSMLAGDLNSMDSLSQILSKANIKYREYKVIDRISAHTPHVLKFKDNIFNELFYLESKPSAKPIFSNLTTNLISQNASDSHYWLELISKPIYFSQTMKNIYKSGYNIFFEMSPFPVLENPLKELFYNKSDVKIFSPGVAYDNILKTIGKLYTSGYNIQWSKVYKNLISSSMINLPKSLNNKNQFSFYVVSLKAVDHIGRYCTESITYKLYQKVFMGRSFTSWQEALSNEQSIENKVLLIADSITQNMIGYAILRLDKLNYNDEARYIIRLNVGISPTYTNNKLAEIIMDRFYIPNFCRYIDICQTKHLYMLDSFVNPVAYYIFTKYFTEVYPNVAEKITNDIKQFLIHLASSYNYKIIDEDNLAVKSNSRSLVASETKVYSNNNPAITFFNNRVNVSKGQGLLTLVPVTRDNMKIKAESSMPHNEPLTRFRPKL